MAKAYKELELIKKEFVEYLDELIAEYKKEKTSLDDVDLEEELQQQLSDLIDDLKERKF
jgi:hypothetical protein